MDVGPQIKLDIKKWDVYWNGKGNNKYPPIGVMNLDMPQKEKLLLLRLILDERRLICRFLVQPCVFSAGGEAALAGCAGGQAPILIPSGGKNPKWMWEQETGKCRWWWARMATLGVPVFLVVSSDEMATYLDGHTMPNVYIVGYDGFGIGCGRAACVRLLLSNHTPGIITDDRTQSVDLDGEPIESIVQLNSAVHLSRHGTVCSVMPKLNCNILTIVRGDRPFGAKHGMFCFPSLFISSKEDCSLAIVMDQTFKRSADYDKNFRQNNFYNVLVHTDTDNPAYINADKVYTGRKGEVLSRLCSSRYFCDSGGAPMTFARWNGAYDFKNMWDVIKMQESALFQLMDHLGDIEPDNIELFKAIANDFFFST